MIDHCGSHAKGFQFANSHLWMTGWLHSHAVSGLCKAPVHQEQELKAVVVRAGYYLVGGITANKVFRVAVSLAVPVCLLQDLVLLQP